jgi:hypothetical protein
VLESGAWTESGQKSYEFLEIEAIEQSQHTLRERINGEFGNGEEFIGRNETTVIAIKLTKSLV